MEGRMLYVLTLAIFYLSGAHAATFTLTNNCGYTVWPGTLTGDNKPQLSSTGFQLASKASTSLTATAPWSGRFWGRTGCTTDSTGKFSCTTGDCASGQVTCKGAGGNPPVTLAEFTLAANNGQDFYDVSLVDGFNLPVSVIPQGGNNCNVPTCPADVNSVCPAKLAVTGSDGSVIACKSACLAFNEPQYCCTGSYSTAATCPPTSYSEIFKNQCPLAYSYAYDDLTGTFTCTGGVDYLITFCP